MANRRMGGMGGGPRGQSFSQQQPFRGSGVNPWQGGSNSNQLISNPQQLALALSSLLQPQQQSNNPPSLLSLNTTPAFNQNRDFGRFGGRGRDMRRHEPYNKNRGGGNWNKNRKPFNKKSPNREPPKKKEEVKTEPEEDKKNEDAGEGSEDKQDSKEGQYKGVPAKYLNCFVCNKQMWDGESMGKHVRGRAHRQMLESMEESMHLTVNILREHMRLSEEKKAIEWDRMQRISKKFKKSHEPESHCNMCDLKFMGKIVAHRKTDGHQRLKRYLHPNCDMCDKEFSSRMDWLEHRLTPEHLQKLCETLESKEGGADGNIIVDEGEPDLEPILEESLQMEADHPILELTDDLTGLQSLLPSYKPNRPIARLSLVEFSGFKCQICNRAFDNEEVAQEHLKTARHFFNFIDAAKAKAKEDQDKKEKEEQRVKQEVEQKTSENGDTEMYDPEEACNENEEKGTQDESQEDIPEDPSDLKTDVEEEEEQEQDSQEQEEQVEEKEEIPAPVPQVQAPKPAPAPTPAPVAAQPIAPVGTRQAPRRGGIGGAVKNGAGPKSKKPRK